MIDYLTSFCTLVYGVLTSQYPEFRIAAWRRQVQIAQAIRDNQYTPELQALAEQLANGSPLDDWVFATLAADLEFAKSELMLTGFYEQAVASLATVTPETQEAAGTALLTQAQGLVMTITGGDMELAAPLLAELQSMALILQPEDTAS